MKSYYLCNVYKTLHAGALASIVDFLTTAAYHTYIPFMILSVTIELKIQCLKAARYNEVIYFLCETVT